MQPELERLVADFQQDLRQMDAVKVVRKHITTGGSAVLTPELYYDLRSEVADHFGIHPSAVVVVGSGRTGFSLKPRKRYVAFGDSSDIDLAIISRDKFEVYWNRAFEHWQCNRWWQRTRRYRGFLRELFQGWLWPRKLPADPQFKEALEWTEFEDKLTRERFRGMRSVGARLYLSWDRLEAYQAIHVLDCKNALPRG